MRLRPLVVLESFGMEYRFLLRTVYDAHGLGGWLPPGYNSNVEASEKGPSAKYDHEAPERSLSLQLTCSRSCGHARQYFRIEPLTDTHVPLGIPLYRGVCRRRFELLVNSLTCGTW